MKEVPFYVVEQETGVIIDGKELRKFIRMKNYLKKMLKQD